MSAQPNYPRIKGPGDLPGDSGNPNSPDYNPPGSVLDCPNETGTWLNDNFAEPIQVAAIEMIGDYISGPMDEYALRKLHRQIDELAERSRNEIVESEARND